MSPTLLEGLMVLVLLVVAWQIGLIIAPIILRELRGMRRSLDEAIDLSDDVLEDSDTYSQKKEHQNGSKH